jgi:hypothetical protein
LIAISPSTISEVVGAPAVNFRFGLITIAIAVSYYE